MMSAGRGRSSSAVVDLSDRRLERVSAADLSRPPQEEWTHGSTEPSPSSSTAPRTEASAVAVRCLILKNNRLTFLPSGLFCTEDAADDAADAGLMLESPTASSSSASSARWRSYGGNKAFIADDKVKGYRLDGEESIGGEGVLSSLRVLDVANNLLSRLPASIGRASSLTVLNLTFNRLTSLPPEIGQLACLRDLYLGCNELTTLPDEIGLCRSLQRLYLNSNPLRTLPVGLGRLNNELVILELSMTHSTLSFPPASVVRKGTRTILGFLLQAREEQRKAEKQARLQTMLAGLATTSTTKQRNEAEEWNKEKARLLEKVRANERRMNLLQIQNKRLELDKDKLQKKLVELVLDKRRLLHETKELEERASRWEIRRHCVVCMDHPRNQILLPCRHFIVCKQCATTLLKCPMCRAKITERLDVYDV